ncbi:MAG: primosomal protein N' [Leptolyngbya sp. PLA1]|nr:primosomal protein N' [Leptolyngbya sp. PLA1]
MRDRTLFAAQETADSGGVFVRVAVERGIDRGPADAALTYRCDPGAGEVCVRVGERVEVPLGRGGKATGGIVVEIGGAELLGDLPPSRVKRVLRRTGAALPQGLLDLAGWMAEYYVSPLGMVLMGMMPAAVKAGTGRRAEEMATRGELPAGAALTKAQAALWTRVQEVGAREFPMPLKSLAGLVGASGVAGLRKLAAAGAIRIEKSEAMSAGELPGFEAVESAGEPRPEPTAEQARVIDGIDAHRGFGVHLLRGVTGSGKTEVYLRLIERVLARGGRAIVLVPEIALTPQTAGRFTRRFGGSRVAVLHSGLTAAQRHREWRRIAGGEAGVVVGARSAVFAPVERLELIVVDEEHDTSYKQDRLPRYQARDVAVKRGQLAGVPVVLGSATPSLESWSNARAGRYRLWELADRVGGAVLPAVRVVDLRLEHRARRVEDPSDRRLHLLGPTLEREIEIAVRAGGQVILLLNRRGFASYVWCRNAACGFVAGCEQCDANLVVHRHEGLPTGGLVRCHHCGAEQRVPVLCPSCGGKVALWGGGTQRAEEELCSKFASLGIVEGQTLLRVDSDTMHGARDYYEALGRFGRGEVRVLVGTQMLAKGLDYPNVRLVGVLDADLSLNIPDFRSSERTFQLVSQVAGRAGRGEHPGLVIVQTYNPGAGAIRFAAAHDYEGFARVELAVRERAGLPPATRMARVVCRDERSERAREAAGLIATHLSASGLVSVRGPMPCVVGRVAGQYRYAVEIVGAGAGRVQAALAGVRKAGLVKSDAKTAVDVDPVALL